MCLLLSRLGAMTGDRGEYTQAETYFQEGLALARQLNYRMSSVYLLINLGMIAVKRRDSAQAEGYLQEGLALARQLRHQETMSGLLTQLGVVAEEQGDERQSSLYLREGLEVARRLGYRWLICDNLKEWGEIQLKQQQIDAAGASFREMLSCVPEGDRELVSEAQYGCARVAEAQGDIREARRLGNASFDRLQTMGHQRASEVRQWLETLPV